MACSRSIGLEEPDRPVAEIHVIAAWQFGSGSCKPSALKTSLHDPLRATVSFTRRRPYNGVSRKFACALLGRRIASVAGRKGRTNKVGIAWTQKDSGMSMTTDLRIIDGLRWDIVMTVEHAEAMCSQTATRCPPESGLKNWLVPAHDLDCHGLRNQDMMEWMPNNRRDYQQSEASSMSESVSRSVLPPFRVTELNTMHRTANTQIATTVQHRPPRLTWDKESCVSSSTADSVWDLGYTANWTALPSHPESQSSHYTLSTDPRWNTQIVNPPPPNPETAQAWHRDHVSRGPLGLPVVELSSANICQVECDHENELKRQYTRKLGDQESAEWQHHGNTAHDTSTAPAESDFESHPGHKYWEWDQGVQRWHKKGGSYEDEADWFPDEFV